MVSLAIQKINVSPIAIRAIRYSSRNQPLLCYVYCSVRLKLSGTVEVRQFPEIKKLPMRFQTLKRTLLYSYLNIALRLYCLDAERGRHSGVSAGTDGHTDDVRRAENQ